MTDADEPDRVLGLPRLHAAVVLALGVGVLIGFFTGGGVLDAVHVDRHLVVSHELDTDRDGLVDTLSVRLASSPDVPILGSELEVLSHGPGGFDPLHACMSTQMAGGQCTEPMTDGDRWRLGTALYFPCPQPGTFELTLTFPSGVVLDERLVCHEAAG